METVLTRQLAVKIDKLANLSERRSVIVHTSTPNISTAAGAASAPTFFGSEEERISSPEVPEAPPFKIFVDPPSEENPIQQIPVLPTPSTAFSVGKENLDPEFLFSRSVVDTGTVANMDEPDEVEKKRIEEKLRASVSILRSYLKTYDTERYSVQILAAN